MTAAPQETPLALVAGATGAIGLAVVRQLSAAGWSILATHREVMPPEPSNVTWVRFDGCDERDIAGLRTALDRVPGRLGCVICCIGQASSKRRVADTAALEYAAVFEGNVTSVVRLWQAIYHRAREGGAGVVLLGSDTTVTMRPGNGAYSAAKAALEALSSTLAAEEAGHGVRVNVVAPSLVASPLAERVLALKGVSDFDQYYRALPWGRALGATEVAAVAVDVAIAAHWSYATGQVVRLSVRNGS